MHVLSYDKEAIAKVKLDVKDKQILTQLALNARTPYSIIAKQVLLSPEAVKYRIQRLQKARVLLGARTLITLSRLGYASYHLFLSLHPPSMQREAGYVDFFVKDQRVNAALQYLGKWDYEISVRTQTASELDAFRIELSKQCSSIQEERIVLLMDTIKSTALPERIFPEIKAHKETMKRVAMKNVLPKEVTIDDEDRRLLRVLADEADLKIEEIARKSGLSRDQVSYRMKRLEKEGIIVGYSPVINYALLGFSIHAVLFKFQARSKERELLLKSYLQNDPAVLWAVRTLGEWDLLIYVVSKDNNDFYKSIGELRERFSDIIKNYETLIAYREYKYTYLPKGAL